MANFFDTICSQLYMHHKCRLGINPSEIKPYPGDVANHADEIKLIHRLLFEAGFFNHEDATFGFHANAFTNADDRKIVFSSTTVGSGPATSIHQFYSVQEAKEFVKQLLIAISEIEGKNNELS